MSLNLRSLGAFIFCNKKASPRFGETNQYWFVIETSELDLVFTPAEASQVTNPLPEQIFVGTVSSVFREDLTGHLSIQVIQGDIDRPGFQVDFCRYLFRADNKSLQLTSRTSCSAERAFNEAEQAGRPGDWHRISNLKLWD